jgi:hypothetical protein
MGKGAKEISATRAHPATPVDVSASVRRGTRGWDWDPLGSQMADAQRPRQKAGAETLRSAYVKVTLPAGQYHGAPHPTHRRFTRMGDRGHNRGSTFKALPNPTRVLPQARRLLPGRGVACGVRRCSGPWRVRTQAPTPNSSVQSCRRNHRVTTTEQGAFLTT